MKQTTGRHEKLLSVRGEKGSLALEQVLFISAIVLMSAGLFIFYDNIRDYFSTFEFPTAQGGVDD